MNFRQRTFAIAAGLFTMVGTVAAEPPAFRLENTGSSGSELNVGVTSDGTIFLGGWDFVARSRDDGGSWDLLSPRPLVSYAADRVLIVDPDTDRVLVNDTTFACTILSWSDDLGETWTTNPLACGGGVTDHQKIAVGARRILADPTGLLYPNVIYVCANGLTHTPCAASFDGGFTFGPGFPGMQLDAEDPGSSRVTCAFQGVPVAGEDGILYQPGTQCGATLWWSDTNGATWTHSELPVAASPDAPDVAITPDGTVYFFYTNEDWLPAWVRSDDGGESWSEPVSMSPGGLRSALFPVITAGDDGRIAVAFYGTFDDPEAWNGNPGDAPDSVRWNLFAAMVTDADTSSPQITTTQVTTNDDPVQIGCLSKLGGCLSNIADYIDVTTGPDGRAYIGYVDGCDGCDTAAESTLDEGWVAIQTTGPRLRETE